MDNSLIDFSLKLLLSSAVNHYTDSGSFNLIPLLFKKAGDKNSLGLLKLDTGADAITRLLIKSEAFRKRFTIPEPGASEALYEFYSKHAGSIVETLLASYLQSMECVWYSVASESWMAEVPDPITPEQVNTIQASGVKSIESRHEVLCILNIKRGETACGSMWLYDIVRDSEGKFLSVSKNKTIDIDGQAHATEGKLVTLLNRDLEGRGIDPSSKTLIENMFQLSEVTFDV